MDRTFLALVALAAVAVGAAAPRPGYLERVRDPELGTTIVRIAGDPGSPIPGLAGGRWGEDARHAYSRQQAWNADGSLLLLQNRDGGTPPRVLLDGRTYRPRDWPCTGSPAAGALYDVRWHPVRANILVNVDKAGRTLSWFDVTTCRTVRSWTLPVEVDDLGSGEGNPSRDGRYVALGNDEVMFVVDMDAPSGKAKTGPLHPLVPCDVDQSSPGEDCRVGNLSISPSGRYVDVKFGGKTPETKDLHRIFAVDPNTLALSPHRMSPNATRCGSFAGRTDGWIYPMKHADLGSDPFDGGADVLVGGRSCPGSTFGRVVKVRLRDGKVTPLTDPKGEASVSHVSMRATGRAGWALVSYFKAQGKRHSDEIVFVKLDGSRTVERLARTHSKTSGCYRCEVHPVASPDGQRVLFASNWASDCTDCGEDDEIQAYVIERVSAQRSTTNLPSSSSPTERTR